MCLGLAAVGTKVRTLMGLGIRMIRCVPSRRLLSAARLPLHTRPVGFAPPPRDGLALSRTRLFFQMLTKSASGRGCAVWAPKCTASDTRGIDPGPLFFLVFDEKVRHAGR